jgi:glycosyltransferase involved in cell wall biosynthesis
MSRRPLVTIGLPVFNTGPLLVGALQSVFAQTACDWELIAIDDGSQDGSAATLASLRDPRVRVLRDGRNRGLPERLNEINCEARGAFIARMDADDLCHPDRLRRQVEFLETNRDVDGVGCAMVVVDEHLEPRGLRVQPAAHAGICAGAPAAFRMNHASFVARREWWLRHPYNRASRRIEDIELWLSSFETSRFANLPDALYFYREFESFSLAKYARAKRSLASLQLRWAQQRGRPLAGILPALRHHRDLGVFSIAVATGLAERLIARRNTPVPAHVADDYRAAVRRISQVVLPSAAASVDDSSPAVLGMTRSRRAS